MSKLELQVLTGVDRLFSDDTRWIRSKVAVNREGQAVRATDPSAIKLCFDGAITAIAHRVVDDEAEARLLAVAVKERVMPFVRARGFSNIPSLNDSRGLSEVRKVIREALAATPAHDTDSAVAAIMRDAITAARTAPVHAEAA